jgi:rare lipoprotein A
MKNIGKRLFLVFTWFFFAQFLFAQSNYYETGTASYYSREFHSKKTASGEKYDINLLTTAHPSLPFNTLVKVTNLKNNKSVVVRINDRGPYLKKRIIDLSKAAAEKIDILHCGTGKVSLELK